MPTLSEDLAFRGLIHQATDPELPKRLDEPGLTVYAGFDPSADSLHVGSLLQLCTLRRFQEAGHRPISLAGGGTGMIGDPGGKEDERQLLTLETIESYLAGIRPQLGQFLDLDRALLLNNADWLGSISTLEFLRDVGKHFTVNQMVAKESVRTRIERPDQGISYTEFSYMLLQAYDFLRLHVDHGCNLQFGGSDQWGNITMGIDLILAEGVRRRGLGVHDAALHRQARRHEVRQRPRRAPSGSTPSGRARSPCTSSSSTPPTSRWGSCFASSPSSATTRSPSSTRRPRRTPPSVPPSVPWPVPSSASSTATPRWPSARRRRPRCSARRSLA